MVLQFENLGINELTADFGDNSAELVFGFLHICAE